MKNLEHLFPIENGNKARLKHLREKKTLVQQGLYEDYLKEQEDVWAEVLLNTLLTKPKL